MKYVSNFDKLDMPEGFQFGVELEAFNVAIKGKNGLYGGESAKYIESKKWHMASKSEESLVGEGGAELVSPILHDTEADWQGISDICEQMKKFPGKHGDEVVTDSKCGLHVHFDAKCLTENPDVMKNFLRLYSESEELLYKMCNDQNDPIRKGAINKNYKGLNFISSLWRNGMAAPTGKKILEQIEKGTLKVAYKEFGALKMIAGKYKLDERRYAGLNLTNIGNPKKNTIEFRMANGTLDPEVIKQNVFLYASLMDTAIKMTENPEQYQEQSEAFYRTDISEEEKAQSFLSLIIEEPEDQQIYMDRWSSVKDAEVFEKNTQKGFSQNRFTRDQIKNIADRTPVTRIQSAFEHIKGIMTRMKTGREGELAYEER